MLVQCIYYVVRNFHECIATPKAIWHDILRDPCAGIFILGLFILPICGLWINARSLLLLLHQPPCIARYGYGQSVAWLATLQD